MFKGPRNYVNKSMVTKSMLYCKNQLTNAIAYINETNQGPEYSIEARLYDSKKNKQSAS